MRSNIFMLSVLQGCNEMPISEHPKSGKRRNWNFWWFGFWNVHISDVWALWNMQILSENRTRLVWAFKPQLSKIWMILFGLSLMSENGMFCPIRPNGCSVFVQKRNFFVWISDAVQILNCLELGQKLNVWEPNVVGFRTLTVFKVNIWNCFVPISDTLSVCKQNTQKFRF